MNATPYPDHHVSQLIDANLDRAREGLRVIEEWCRFALDRKDLVITLKNYRHQLGQHHHEDYKKARSTSNDQGAGLTHPAQAKRIEPQEIISANFARAQEALRVLEEFCRHSAPELAKIAANIRYEIYDLEIQVLEASKRTIRRQKIQHCNLCLITAPHPNLINIVSEALKAGVKMVQYRCKEEKDTQRIFIAKELASLCKKYDSLFIVNDRVDIALAIDADGVHLGQDDFPVNLARKVMGSEKLIGVSTHSLDQLLSAQKEDCDYIGLGPIYTTDSKPGSRPIGIDYLKEINKSVELPCFAIGGINITNVNNVI